MQGNLVATHIMQPRYSHKTTTPPPSTQQPFYSRRKDNPYIYKVRLTGSYITAPKRVKGRTLEGAKVFWPKGLKSYKHKILAISTTAKGDIQLAYCSSTTYVNKEKNNDWYVHI